MTDEAEKFSWFVKLFNAVGFPVMVVAAMSAGIWYASLGLGKYVLVPMANGHLELLDTVKKGMERQTNVLEDINKTNQGILQKEDESQHKVMELLSVQLGHVAEKMDKHFEQVQKDHQVMMQALEKALKEN